MCEETMDKLWMPPYTYSVVILAVDDDPGIIEAVRRAVSLEGGGTEWSL